MNADRQGSSRSVYAPVQEPAPKPALGPPHDTWATLFAVLGLASMFFFFGRVHVVNDWIGWSGLMVSAVVGFACLRYFHRAYGFAWRWLGNPVNGAGLMAIFGTTLMISMVSSAMYEQYAGENMLALVLSCLAMAMAIVGALRVGLGKAQPNAQ